MRLISLVTTASCAAAAAAAPYDFIQAQANATLRQISGASGSNVYPSNGQPGVYGWDLSSATSWTSGFFPATLFKLANLTYASNAALSAYWYGEAATLTAGLASNQYNTGTHDVGFIMFYTYGQMFEMTGDPLAKTTLLNTAASLATRFVPSVGCTRSWNSPASENEVLVIADNLMNLELLWWAGAQGNVTYTNMAASHADRMIKDLFQPFNPGCVWHVITYDQTSGDVRNKSSTPQGLGLDTVWSRGQAWTIYGYTMSFRYSQAPRYLDQAMAAADCYIRLLSACCGADTPFKWAPWWDFNVTEAQISVDTSSMMIAASALAELSYYTPAADAARYKAFATTLVESATENYLFTASENDAVLRNGTVTYPLAGISIVYGDYYYLEAKMKLGAA